MPAKSTKAKLEAYAKKLLLEREKDPVFREGVLNKDPKIMKEWRMLIERSVEA